MSLGPRLKKFLRFGLTGVGATTAISAIMSIVSVYKLVEPSDEQTVGLTPGDFVGFYAVLLAGGLGLMFLGLRRWK